MFDKDNSGSISAAEIREALSVGKGLDDDTVNAIIQEVDENGDEEIQFSEYVDMMLKNTR